MNHTASLRIAIISDYFFDYVGGAQTSMRQQKHALEQAGHTVFVISPARGAFSPRLQHTSDGLEVKPAFRLPGLDMAVIPNSAQNVAALTDYLRNKKIDVVHVQTEFGLAHAATTAAATVGIPTVHTVHSFYWASDKLPQKTVARVIQPGLQKLIGASIPSLPLTDHAADNVLRNLVLVMAQRADRLISPSAHQAHDLERAGVGGPVAVIPNPVATADNHSRPLALTDLATPRFLWVARCETVKRPLPFARAVVDALERTNNGFSVDFVGDGAELAALRSIAEGHPNIRVHGALPHDKVLGMMDASAAVVLTSHGFDNQPMTIAEAVSRERGVLYCDPKLREGLSNSGFLAETEDEAGLSDALVALVSNPQLLVKLSEGASTDRELFSPGRYVASVTAVYREAALVASS